MLYKTPINLLFLITLLTGILWQGGVIFWFGIAISSIIILISFYLITSFNDLLQRPTGNIHLVLLAFTVWCFTATIFSPIPFVSSFKAITTSTLLIGLYLYFLMCSQPKQWERLWLTIIGAGVILAFYTFLELSLGLNTPNSLFFNKNTHAAYLNLMILPTIAYFLLSTNKNDSSLLGIGLFFLTLSHALPGSRGATFGQLMGVALILLIAWPYLSRQKLKQFSIIYMSALALATIATSNIFRFFAYKLEDTDLGRYEIWDGALKLWANTPWHGNGFGTYWLLHPAYRHINDPSSGQNAHNDYLQFLIEGGFPALTLLIFLMASITYYWLKAIRSNVSTYQLKIELTALFASFIAIAFHALFTYNFGILSILFLIGLLLGRFHHLTKKTKYISLSSTLPIKASLFKISLITGSIALIIYFIRFSFFSYYYEQATHHFNLNKISQADSYASLAISINPQDDRSYTLYAQIYSLILEKIPELTTAKKEFYISKSMQYLEVAEQLNPYRPAIYMIRAQLINDNHMYFKGDKHALIIQLYEKALKVDPRNLRASRQYAQFLVANNNIMQAQDVIFDNLKRYHSNNDATYIFYQYAQSLLLLKPNERYKRLLHIKINEKRLHFDINQLPIPIGLKQVLMQ